MLPRVPKNQDKEVTAEETVLSEVAPTVVALNSETESTEAAAIQPAQSIPATVSSQTQELQVNNVMCDSEDADVEYGVISLVQGQQINDTSDPAALAAILAAGANMPRRATNLLNNSKVRAKGAVISIVGGHQIGIPKSQANEDDAAK